MPHHLTFDLCFRQNFSDSIAVIVDGSDVPWNGVCAAAERLINALPVAPNGVWFSGNPSPYTVITPRDFSEQVPGWFHENRGRVTLLNPILERLAHEQFPGMIAIVTAIEPIDLHDWIDTEILEQVVLIRVGDTPLTDYVTELPSDAPVDLLAAQFRNPVRTIAVEGPGFAPLCWDCKDGRRIELCFNGREFSLLVAAGGGPLDLHVKAVGTEMPQLMVTREKGGVLRYSGVPEASWFREPEWQAMTADNREIFSALASNRPFRCQQCDRLHPAGTFICPEGDVILRGIPAEKVILFTRDRYLTVCGWEVWPLRNGTLLTAGGQRYRFRAGLWDPCGELQLTENVDDSMWAVCHRL